jgi:hypothetical protein
VLAAVWVPVSKVAASKVAIDHMAWALVKKAPAGKAALAVGSKAAVSRVARAVVNKAALAVSNKVVASKVAQAVVNKMTRVAGAPNSDVHQGSHVLRLSCGTTSRNKQLEPWTRCTEVSCVDSPPVHRKLYGQN